MKNEKTSQMFQSNTKVYMDIFYFNDSRHHKLYNYVNLKDSHQFTAFNIQWYGKLST